MLSFLVGIVFEILKHFDVFFASSYILILVSYFVIELLQMIKAINNKQN